MNKNTIISGLSMLFILIIGACCKDDGTDILPDDYRLWSSATCNRYFKSADSLKVFKPIWAADYTILGKSSDTTLSIELNTHYLSGNTYESLYFANVPFKVQSNKVKKKPDTFNTVLAAKYVIQKDFTGLILYNEGFVFDTLRNDNSIAITNLDKENNLVEGTFHLTFYSPTKKDTLYFRNGTFTGPYPK